MNTERLHVAFLWHQHQPYYKDPSTGIYQLPWVRLHGVKDYYDMAEILDHFPRIKQNFNLVPSLLKQLQDYVERGAVDQTMILTLKDPDELSPQEKNEILKTFFLANHKRMIDPYPRYRELLAKRGTTYRDEDFNNVKHRFKRQDYLDLQVWYNLCWTGESYKSKSPFKELLEKGKNYTPEDKQILIKAQINILKLIIPKYCELSQRGQIELSVSPFYHPILPLLCDTQIAKQSQPKITLPKSPFSHPEDAELQLKKAIDYCQEVFGRRPEGIWPPEGGVSEEVLRIASANGIKWMATDEEILFESLKSSGITGKNRMERLYQPYQFDTGGGIIKLVFRDHRLSDLIGFVYSEWDAERAARHLIGEIHQIRMRLIKAKKGLKNCILTIIMDGENCWEHYPRNGRDFLETLYTLLSEDKLIQTTTIGGFLQRSEQWEKLPQLFPGSWINHTFSIWIGHREDNTAWDYLTATRDFLSEKAEKLDPKDLQEAWEEILIAEGSDWCWWYGDEHTCLNDMKFDRLFRSHLIRVYELLDAEPPAFLYKPIRRTPEEKSPLIQPRNFISPKIDGISSHYLEWKGAGFFDCLKGGEAMHRTSSIVKHIYFGFDLENLYVRLDPRYPLTDLFPLSFVFSFIKPVRVRITIFADGNKLDFSSPGLKIDLEAALDESLEVKLPFKKLGFEKGQEVAFQINIEKESYCLERWPLKEAITFNVPDETFELSQWQV